MGYSKAETIKKKERLVSKTQRYGRKVLVNVFKAVLVGFIALIISLAGVGFGMFKGMLDNAPDISTINVVPKGYRTTIHEGYKDMTVSTIESNREYVYYEDIPQDCINAFVAIEDERFWEHNGIDIRGIGRAFVHGVTSGNFNQGASTITQQLIKNQVFDVGRGEATFLDSLNRKVQEQYLALELEKKYSKEELLEYYLNTIYLGRGASGVQAAANTYFGKDIQELTMSEIATIAGVTQNPTKYDPLRQPEESAKRRERVLKKMLELKYITQPQYEEALADDVFSRIQANNEKKIEEGDIYTYYEDAILSRLRDDFMEMYGLNESQANNLIFTGGYDVYSCEDHEITKLCEEVINNSDQYFGFYRVGLTYTLTILDGDGETVHNYYEGHLVNYFRDLTGNDKYDNIYNSDEEARVAADQFKEAKLSATGGTFIAENVVITPQPQFSFTIMDYHTGYVKAMIGGRGDKTANRGLNRATDSPRQPGSCFKILAAYLPFFDTNMGGLATPIDDAPFAYGSGRLVKNWYGGYRGPSTCRLGIQDSMNVLAVKVITQVTPEVSYDYITNMGVTTLVDQEVGADGALYSDKTQSMALGGLTYGVTTYEMAGAYGAIANGGIYVKPVLYTHVTDHEGNVVIDNRNPDSLDTTKRVIKATTAWQLIEGMKSVVSSGTGTPCKMRTGIMTAGKTGTASKDYDLWFCGLTPYYSASIWMGYDSNRAMAGLGSVHEVVWREIMDSIATYEGQDPSLDIMERPEGITTVTLCKLTGKLPGGGCPTCTDYIAVDAIPTSHCGGHETIKFCLESHKLANEACPETVEFSIEIDEETGARKLVALDGTESPSDFEITEEHCDIHLDAELKVETSAGDGGSISGSVEDLNQGDSVTVYITPNEGYRIKDVTIDGASVGPQSQVTISDISGPHSVNATFEPVNTEQPPTEAPPTEAPPTEAPPTEAPPQQPVDGKNDGMLFAACDITKINGIQELFG